MEVYQTFRANGKLLLTSEYFIMDGARGLAFPTKLGQILDIHYEDKKNSQPFLSWKAFDYDQRLWIEAKFDLDGFDLKGDAVGPVTYLQNSLKAVRSLNPQFLKGNKDIQVETRLEFAKDWGLGSSSTLISLIAQWAEVDVFELYKLVSNGSGYDVACAMSETPILFNKEEDKLNIQTCSFSPVFQENLYFVYLNQKQDTLQSIQKYKSIKRSKDKIIKQLNNITDQVISCQNLSNFEALLSEHEDIISNYLDISKVRDLYFIDYWGSIKFLGAWGGDFVLATSDKSLEETKEYFDYKGYKKFFQFNEIIIQ
ncbi:MAG: GYDIA family GHMP kinase [Pseudomonadota bacterium]